MHASNSGNNILCTVKVVVVFVYTQIDSGLSHSCPESDYSICCITAGNLRLLVFSNQEQRMKGNSYDDAPSSLLATTHTVFGLFLQRRWGGVGAASSAVRFHICR